MDLFANIDVDLKRFLEVVTARQQQDTDVWLDAIKDDDQYEELVTIRLDGTCNWILDHPAYTTWVSESLDDGVAKLLWINGPAGFGKSVLSASLIRHLGTTPEMPLAYCFLSAMRKASMDCMGLCAPGSRNSFERTRLFSI